MQNGMLDAANVLVNRSPVIYLVLVKRQLVVMRVSVAEIIPGRTDKGIHGIGLTPCRLAALRAGAVHEGLALSQRRNRPLLELHILRQHNRQLVLRHKLLAAVRAVNHRNRCTPVTLTGNQPVTEAVVHAALAKALRLCLVHDALHGSLDVHAGELSGIYQHAGLVHISLGHFLQLQLPVLRLEGDDDIQVVLGSEHPVTLILGRNADNSACAVLCQHIVGNPDFHLVAVERINGIEAGEDAFLLGFGGSALHLGLILGLLAESPDFLRLRIVLANPLNERMLCRQRQEGDAVHGIRTGGISCNLLPQLRHIQAELQALAAANPVLLHDFYALRPALQQIQVLQKHIGIISDFQEPLGQILLHHIGIAAPALALDNLLIGQHRAAGLAPVYISLFLVGKPPLVEKLEQPLGPAIVVRAAGSHRPVPVIGQAHLTLLALHVVHVGVGPVRRLYTVLDGSILCRHAEGIKAHRMNDIEPLHSLVAGQHIADGIVAHMPHVQIAGRIREHLQGIILRLLRVHLGLVDILSQPLGLPFLFYALR